MSRHARRNRARRCTHAAATGAITLAALGLGAGVARADTFTVTTTGDTGAGSLRDAIDQANADDTTADTITFASGLSGTITLASPLDVTSPVDLEGPGAGTLSLSGPAGDSALRLYGYYAPGGSIDVTLAGLTLTGAGAGVSADYADVSMTDAVVTGNGLADTAGGGIQERYGSLTLNRVTVAGNRSGGDGGGIYAANLSLTDSTVSGNRAQGSGGGVFADGSSTLTGVTVSGNTAQDEGGGLALAGPTSLVGDTITANTAADGGGVETTGNDVASLDSTVVAGNQAYRPDDDLETDGGSFTAKASLVENPGSVDLMGGAISGQDPLLGPLTDNGGPTLTQLPQFGSPLLDAGEAVAPTTLDQRGLSRTVDLAGVANAVDGTDIGAAEAQSAPDAPAGPTGPSGPTGAAGTTTTVSLARTPPPAAPIAPAATDGRFLFGATIVTKRGRRYVQVTLPSGGRVTASGGGVKRISRSFATAGAKKLPLTLSAGARRTLAHKGRVTLRFAVVFTPTGGSATTRPKALTVRTASRRAAHAPRGAAR